VESYNRSLESFIKENIARRKEKLRADRQKVEALGIPIKRRSDLLEAFKVPAVRRKPKIAQPPQGMTPTEQQYFLDMEEYKYILRVLSDMSVAMERSPCTFRKLKEEEIRDFFLIVLNGHYEGRATGETFNGHGDTDILIRYEGRNVFIAECKIWDGEKKFRDGIDQLLGYTTWRDTKTAILVFSKKRDFTSVKEKIDSSVRAHACYKRSYQFEHPGLDSDTTFSYILHHPDDENRELTLTVMAFNIPDTKAETKIANPDD